MTLVANFAGHENSWFDHDEILETPNLTHSATAQIHTVTQTHLSQFNIGVSAWTLSSLNKMLENLVQRILATYSLCAHDHFRHTFWTPKFPFVKTSGLPMRSMLHSSLGPSSSCPAERQDSSL